MARPSNQKVPAFRGWAMDLLFPAILLSYALYYMILTILTALVTRPAEVFTQFQKVKDAAFSRLWIAIGTMPDPPPKPETLQGSTALFPPLLQQATGNVLEIGPGTGDHLPWSNASAIKSYYVAEPALGLHTTLNKRAKSAGFMPGKNFHILPCGGHAEALIPGLRTAGLLKSDAAPRPIFDSIITCRVLCSVPSGDFTAENLHALLKPGGKLIFLEHVANPWTGPHGSLLGRSLQRLYSALGWSFLIGGCNLNRDTESSLRRAGAGQGADWAGWLEDVDGGVTLSFPWSPLPYISGVLTKR